jgi:uncharacterized metal-binding protein YceD (DUF177 family)
MTANEFSRPVRLDTIGAQPRMLALEADPAERSALAARFGLPAVEALAADLQLAAVEGGIRLWGPMRASVTQACVATGAPVPAEIADGVDILFRPAPDPDRPDEEIELEESELDVMFHDGAVIDAGEAVAQSLLLALDPYPRAPEAEAALREAGVKSEEEAGPFAALAGLRDKLKR